MTVKPDKREALKALRSVRRQLSKFFGLLRISELPEIRQYNNGFYDGIREARDVVDDAIRKHRDKHDNKTQTR